MSVMRWDATAVCTLYMNLTLLIKLSSIFYPQIRANHGMTKRNCLSYCQERSSSPSSNMATLRVSQKNQIFKSFNLFSCSSMRSNKILLTDVAVCFAKYLLHIALKALFNNFSL